MLIYLFCKSSTMMKISGLVLLLSFLSHRTASERQVIVERGGNVVLPCFDRSINTTNSSESSGFVTLLVTRWMKNGALLITRNHSEPLRTNHYEILNDGSLNITSLMIIDEGRYQCDPKPKASRLSQSIELQVTDGPANLTLNVQPTQSFQNGTRFANKGTVVSFNCTSKTHPSQNLTWTFTNASQKENVKAFQIGPWLEFLIHNLQPADQGNYSCQAQNLASMRMETKRLELLVYYAPERHPDCSWELGADADQVHFGCSWHGGNPPPNLTVYLDSEGGKAPTLAASGITEDLKVILNRSTLYEGQNITCVGRHVTGDSKRCYFTLRSPFPMGEPLVAALEDSNVTLTCSETSSLPPATTSWQRGEDHKPILPSSKYVLSEEGPIRTLTVVNVTQDDAGLYFCWSENLLTAKELEVYLTVRASADNSGAVVGVFLSILIVAAGMTLGMLVYSRRDRICLRFPFGHLEEDRADVMSLVESDEDEVFRDTVPRLPPVLNGHVSTSRSTTLVEIHRIQSSDHEDNIDADQADQEQEQPDECNGETL